MLRLRLRYKESQENICCWDKLLKKYLAASSMFTWHLIFPYLFLPLIQNAHKQVQLFWWIFNAREYSMKVIFFSLCWHNFFIYQQLSTTPLLTSMSVSLNGVIIPIHYVIIRTLVHPWFHQYYIMRCWLYYVLLDRI